MEFMGKTFLNQHLSYSQKIMKSLLTWEELQEEKYQLFSIEVEGHTDDSPISSKYYLFELGIIGSSGGCSSLEVRCSRN